MTKTLIEEVQELTKATTALLSAVNVKKATLDGIQADVSVKQQLAAASEANAAESAAQIAADLAAATDSAGQAAASATAAHASETAAASSAAQALASKQASDTNATSALASKNAAAVSEQTASAAAVTATMKANEVVAIHDEIVVQTPSVLEAAALVQSVVTSEANAAASAQAAANSEASAFASKQASDANAAASLASKDAAAASALAASGSETAASTAAATATAKATEATSQAAIATSKAAEATTQAGIAQTAATDAADQAAIAASYAASAARQDLTGVTGVEFHRSPGNIAALFIYDTSKDSDGGAWVDRCQHTSWYSEVLSGAWLGGQVSEAAARAVPNATTGDYFQLSTDGKFYKLNAGAGTTEAFRGTSAKFPRISAIVAESGSSITIYDLTQPGWPMWMRFNGANGAHVGSNIYCVAAKHGRLFVGGNDGLSIVDFIADKTTLKRSSSSSLHLAPIGKRNTVAGYSAEQGVAGIVNSSVYFLAIEVMNDAAINPATNLAVPTVAVMTGGGVSVIKHDGSVSSHAFSVSGVNDGICFTPAGTLLYGNSLSVSGFRFIRVADISGSTFTGNTLPQSVLPGYASKLEASDSTQYLLGSYAAKADIFRLNAMTPGASLRASITPFSSSGIMVGDIRRCFLADVQAETLGPVTELMSNGTFSSYPFGWNNGSYSTASVVSGEFQVTVQSAGGRQVYAIATVPGKVYKLTGKLRLVSGTGQAALGWAAFSSGTDFGPVINATTANATLTSLQVGEFVATGTTSYIYAGAAQGTGSNGSVYGFDDISVIEAVADRSPSGKSLSIYGSLTKTPVAVAAELVAYSGFTNVNYLREAYSSALDFTDFSISAWFSTTEAAPANLLTQSEFANGLADAPVYGGNITATALTGYGGALQFGASTCYAFKNSYTTVAGNTYTLSAVVSMDDAAGPPVFTSSTINSTANDFALSIGGITANPLNYTVTDLGGGRYRVSGTVLVEAASASVGIRKYGSRLFKTSGWQLEIRASATSYKPTTTTASTGVASIYDRSASGVGASVLIGMDSQGYLFATVFDGTTTRTATTTSTYLQGKFQELRVNFLAGRLALNVNAVEAASANGSSLSALTNASAVLTIGNNSQGNAAFPGSLALVKASATVPTPEQALWAFSQDRQMFKEGALITLPDSSGLNNVSYDDLQDTWTVSSGTYESSWSGLVRTASRADPDASTVKSFSRSGIKIRARVVGGSASVVDLSVPSYKLREELLRRAELSPNHGRSRQAFDFDCIGFTASTTNTSDQLTSVTVTSGTPYVGMGVSGSGIPAGAYIKGINGTTYTLSAPATATASGVAIGQTTFATPPGYCVASVRSAGSSKREGAAKDWTRATDGFKETVKFGVSPGSATWVQVEATRI